MVMHRFLEKIATLCRPKDVHLCDGTEEEFDRIAGDMVAKGSLVPLNSHLRPHSFGAALIQMM